MQLNISFPNESSVLLTMKIQFLRLCCGGKITVLTVLMSPVRLYNVDPPLGWHKIDLFTVWIE